MIVLSNLESRSRAVIMILQNDKVPILKKKKTVSGTIITGKTWSLIFSWNLNKPSPFHVPFFHMITSPSQRLPFANIFLQTLPFASGLTFCFKTLHFASTHFLLLQNITFCLFPFCFPRCFRFPPIFVLPLNFPTWQKTFKSFGDTAENICCKNSVLSLLPFTTF